MVFMKELVIEKLSKTIRLGNYFDIPNSDQCPFRIDAFEYLSKSFIKVAMIHSSFGKNMHPLTWYGDNLTPIKLTKEELINFGFEWSQHTLGYSNEHHIVYILEDGSFEIHLFCTNDKNFHLKIQYVYELQNLCFYLGNQELVLKN